MKSTPRRLATTVILPPKRRWKWPLIIVLACFFLATVLAYPWLHARYAYDIPPSNNIITFSTPAPGEAKVPVTDQDYQVPPDQPRVIRLPRQQSEGYIQRVSVDNNNHIAVPTNVHLAGWYTGSVKPGDEGLSIIDGHVSGRYSPGIFAKLKDMQVGDPIEVSFGDGTVQRFQVTATRAVALNDVTDALFEKSKDVDRQLNLITFGGEFNKGSKTYARRVIVTAKAVDK